MSKRRKWAWTAGILAAAVAAAAVTTAVVSDPLKLPGSHKVEVYAQDDAISGEAPEEPGFLGRTLGMCDADTYYAQDGDRKLCIVLSGPLGEVEASRKDGRVTVEPAEVAKLKAMTGPGTTTLVLMGSGPAALIPVAGLAEGQAVNVRALS
ncbi:hypothetical protein JIG36_48290 [Actinoplanes sp. LDG1-06]|uniref:Uncharacterized protein n=1 Tax=Paractinoplanes ovalisporus TaxID=2810368 RepID=A0ABS2ATX1_9ACTN|nr:hypothetical protein [Actinoplanes ovalisporus]MBM2623323.1 hypothetical protein [Actinoplanes ovalisporus]